MLAWASRCWKSRPREARRIIPARRHPRADRTGCRRRGGADQGGRLYANIAGDLAALVHDIERGAGLAIIAEEAIKTVDLRSLVNWLNDQPSWSDFPIVLLTHQGGGPERNPDAARLGQVLGNVTFIERPFHPTTLVSIVGSAVRGRRRQYQTRAILADLTESEGLLQTALNAGHLGALELRLPELELEASD